MTFRAYDDVRLLRGIAGNGFTLPPGSKGVVTKVIRRAPKVDLLEVEFRQPAQCMADVPADSFEFDN